MASLPVENANMTEDDLASFLDEHATRAIGHYGSEIASDQARALDYYSGRMQDLPAVEGCSSVVDATVQVVVDNYVANIIKPFVSTDEAVRFEPRGPEDEEAAEQATDYVNYVFNCDNPGFMIVHDWVKDAGMQKLGVVKVYWEDKTDKRPQFIEHLDPVQAEQIEFVDGPYLDETTGLFSGFVMSDYEDGKIKIENIPPEEYLISPYARPGEVPPYEAQRTRKSRSELINELGFDERVVAELAPADGSSDDMRTQSRYRDEQHDNRRNDGFGDPSRDLIEVYHEFALIDYDGDGVSELREIIRSGKVILYNEESDGEAFHRYCPVPMPHKVYGRAIADLVINDQRVKTVLQRQQLDNLYKSNNPRPHLPDGSERADGSTAEDLMDTTPGAAVREGKMPIRYEAVPFVADKVFQMQEYTDREIERKTGIAKEGQSLDRNALNTSNQMTATQAALMEEGQNARAELMARIFAETGLRSLFKSVLRLLVKHQPRERVIRLRNKWVPMDPRGWNVDMDVVVSVGLGVGNQQEQLAQADSVLMTMAELAQSPFASLLTKENVYNAVKRKYTAAGIKNAADYITEPERDEEGNIVPEQEQPDPEAMKVQAEAEMQAAKLQGEQQIAAFKLQMQREEGQLKIQLARDEAQAQAQLAREKAMFEAQLAREKLALEQELATERMRIDEARASRDADRRDRETDSKMSQNRSGGDLDK